MCSQYCFDEDTGKEIRRIAAAVDEAAGFCGGTVRPSDCAPVIIGCQTGLRVEKMKWGFPSYVSNQLMINARAETVLEKKSFSESVRYRRCVIPARHFYEWDRQKQKAEFCRPDGKIIYMAGIYNIFEDGNRFTVLTTKANESVLPVHDRMPLILEDEGQLREWICDPGRTGELLEKAGPMLERRQEYEQLSLF